jgi:DNA polymerase III alpha subunit (gram-positive type)
MIALVIDTETDGLVANHILALDKLPSVIEYCGLLVNLKTSKLLNEFTTLVRPVEYPMTAKTIEDSKTKLNNGMLEAAPRFQSVSDTIRKQIETAPVVIAHNLSFDKEIIDTAFERLGQILIWPRRLICSVEQTAYLTGKRLTLTNLHRHLFKKDFDEAHRARSDTEALMRCCIRLYKMGVIA